MRPRPRPRPLLPAALASALLALSAPAPSAAAQWGAAVEVGAAWFGGTSLDTATTGRETLRPYRPTRWGLQLERRLGRVRVALGGYRAKAGVAEEGRDATVVAAGVFTLREVLVEVGWRLLETGPGTRLWLQVGPVYDHWDTRGGEDRVRWGGHAAVSAEWRIAGRLSGAIRLAHTATPSVFQPGELPSGFARRAMRRTSVSLGLGWGR